MSHRRLTLWVCFTLTALVSAEGNGSGGSSAEDEKPEPPFLFPHGYFDSAKLKPFDAIYLNLMAQSNLEYGGITLEELDKLDAIRKLVARPKNLPRTREEDDVLLDRVPLPLDTDAIAPGPKDDSQPRPPRIPFSSIIGEIGKPSKNKAGEGTVPRPTRSHSNRSGPDSGAPIAKPIVMNRGVEDSPARPPSPFMSIRRLQRRYRRAADEDAPGSNPFEEIATRAPPRDQVEFNRVRNYLRRSRNRKQKKRRRPFLTRDDIYDPERSERERLSKEERKKLREELALKTDSDEEPRPHLILPPVHEGGSISERHKSRPQHAPSDELLDTDLRTTAAPHSTAPTHPTLIQPKFTRHPNNPFGAVDISKPTVLHLPIPPIDEEFERR